MLILPFAKIQLNYEEYGSEELNFKPIGHDSLRLWNHAKRIKFT